MHTRTVPRKPTVPRLEIAYALADSPYGLVAVAATAAGICAVDVGFSADETEAQLRREFPGAVWSLQPDRLGPWLDRLLAYLAGERVALDMPLDVRGTPFQKEVWQAIRAIPYGEVAAYGDVARAVGRPRAFRAVGQACGANPTPLIVPCHRVVQKDGSLGGFGLRPELKRRLLALEGRDDF